MRALAAVLGSSALVSVGLLACDERASEPSQEAPGAAPEDACVAEAEAAARRLGKALKTRLMDALADGPEAAVAVCAQEAQAIHRRVAEETGARVGRSSTKLRNPANGAAPAWVRTYLQRHAERPGPWPEVREREGATGRALLPLPSAGVCQTCHGQAVSPPLRAAIAERYPDDQAVGFGPEELRGVIWAEAHCE